MARMMKRLVIPGIIAVSLPVVLPSASRFFSTTQDSDNGNPFYGGKIAVECEPGLKRWGQSAITNTPVHAHEYKARSAADGLHLRLYMAGVAKENLKVWVDGGDLIAEGLKDKDFEDEDDSGTLMRYRVMGSEKLFDLDAMEADINNGMLKVFVPRRSED